MESYKPVLDMLKHRNETDWTLVAVIVTFLIALPVLLYLGNKLRLKIQRSRNRERAFRMLERFGTDKGLSYSDQEKLADIAEFAGLKNPSLLLESVKVFDRTVSLWMKHAMQLPWLEMEDEIAWCKRIRNKIGFRYLPEGFSPSSTRELPLECEMFAVVPNKGKFQVLTSRLIALDDLALYTSAFKYEKGQSLRGRLAEEFWCLFWSSRGEEYRFKSQVLKVLSVPKPVLFLEHGDQLSAEVDRSVFFCGVKISVTIEWASAEEVNVIPTDVKVFDESDKIKTMPARINSLSSVGFRLDFIENIAPDDLIRIKTDAGAVDFLSNVIGQVIRCGGRGIGCRFLDFPEAHRQKLLHYLVKRASFDTLEERLRKKPE